MFKTKDGYKLESQTPKTMKQFDIIKELIDQTKNRKNVPSLEVVEVVVVQCNLVDNQYQQKLKVLYTFMPNKFYAYLVNIEPSNLVFLKTYKTDSDEIITKFMDNIGRPLEIENEVNWTLKNDMIFHRVKNKKMC